MLRILSPFILFIPVIGLWQTGAITFSMMFMIGVGWAILCLYQAGSRGRRTTQYEILCRLFLTAWLPGLVFAYALRLSMWTTTTVCLFAIFMVVVFRWLVFRIGDIALSNDADLQRLKQSGYSFFWDTFPPPWNPDSQFVRAGGLPEPQYKNGFVPPSHWQYQCPRCGARWETNFGQCYNCDYGHDGRSDDYYALYPHERPQTQAPPQQPPEQPPQSGPFVPVEPWRD